MDKQNFIIPHKHDITAMDRNRLNGHNSLVVWFTGLSGSGKSTIANRLEQLLLEQKMHTYLLDGDNIRAGLNKGLTFSEEDRNENLRRIAEVAKLLIDAGLVVLGAFVSPIAKDRDMVKKIIGSSHFVQVYVATSLEECERRDVKGLYAKAKNGEIKNFTGLSAPYEVPEDADLVIQTEGKSIEQSARLVLNYLLDNNKIQQL